MEDSTKKPKTETPKPATDTKETVEDIRPGTKGQDNSKK